MKTFTAIIVAAFAAGTAHAANFDCHAVADDNRLSGETRANFIKECMSDQVALTGGERPAARAHRAREDNKGATAGCQTIEGCGDLSTQLEATAAGLGGSMRANSGHSFVRVKRVSE